VRWPWRSTTKTFVPSPSSNALLDPAGANAIDDGLGTTVYVELRHGQRPIDPQPWLKSDKRSKSR